MDLLKWSLTLIVGFGASYVVFDQLEQRRTERLALCETVVTRMQRAAEEMERASFGYLQASRDAFIELYRWRDEQPSAPLRHYWGPASHDFTVALEGLQRRFRGYSEIEAGIAKVSQGIDFIVQAVDPLIARRLERIESFYTRSANFASEPTPRERLAAMAPIGQELQHGDREKFNAAFRELAVARGELIEAVERILGRPTSQLCWIA